MFTTRRIPLYLLILLSFFSFSIPHLIAVSSPPLWLNSQPTIDSVDKNWANFQVKFNQAVTVYYVITTLSGSEPTPTQVRNGEDSGDGQLVTAGSQTEIAADTYSYIDVCGLQDGVTYNAYFIGENSSTDISTVGSVTGFTTTAIHPLIYTCSPAGVSDQTNAIPIKAGMNESGIIHYAVYPSNSLISVDNVISGTGAVFSGIIPINTPYRYYDTSITGFSLPAGYDFYFAGIDDSGNKPLSPKEGLNTCSGALISDLSFNIGDYSSRSDDYFKIDFSTEVLSTWSVNDYTLEYKPACKPYAETQTLVPVTDFSVSVITEKSVKILLTESGLTRLDDTSQLGPIFLTIYLNAAAYTPILNGFNTFALNFNNSNIHSASLNSIKYQQNSAGLDDDIITLSMTGNMTNVGTELNYRIEVDNDCGGDFISPDFTLSNTDFKISSVKPNEIDISLTNSGVSKIQLIKNAAYRVTLLNPSAFTPVVNRDFSSGTVSITSQPLAKSEADSGSISLTESDQNTSCFIGVMKR